MAVEGVENNPQVTRSHYLSNYDNFARWSSYWIQIDEALSHQSERVLEVGIGNRLTSMYLKDICDLDITTVDIDPMLAPDLVADIRRLPFEDRAFGLVMACEVLEHLPLEGVQEALLELRRVSSVALISVPDLETAVQLELTVRRTRRRVQFGAPWLFRKEVVSNSSEHFWEIGVGDMKPENLVSMANTAGWKVSRSFRNPYNLFHHFFLLE